MKKITLLLTILSSSGFIVTAQDTWVQKSDLGIKLPTSVHEAVSFNIDGKGYVGTGSDKYGELYNTFWEYDPSGNTWTQKADFGGTARFGAVGFSIGNKGYMGTGYYSNGNNYKKDFWEYDPDFNTWTKKADFAGSARYDATGFSIGNKGYIGTGYDVSSSYKKDFWEYDPAADKWTQKSDFISERLGAAGFSIDSLGYMGTGYKNDGSSIYYQDFWEYRPDIDTWTQKADFAGGTRSYAVGFSIGSKGYLGTGSDNSWAGTLKKDFWEYDPSNNTWVQKEYFQGASRDRAIGFSIGNKGYVGMGYAYDDVNDFWEYSANNDTWTQKTVFNDPDRYAAVGFSIGDKGYIGTGFKISSVYTYYKDFWKYNADDNTWTQVADFGGSARYDAVGFSVNDKGYVGTGRGPGALSDFWEYDPNTNSWTQKADCGGGERYGATGFSIGNKGYAGAGYNKKDFWEYDPNTDHWAQKADFGGGERWRAVGFSIISKGYIGTGYSFDGNDHYYKDFWEYDPNINSWLQKADFGGAPRYGASAFSIGTNGYIGTGKTSAYSSQKDFWEYNSTLNSWTQKSNVGGTVRNSAVGFSIGSKGYIGTGEYITYVYQKDFWEYTPQCNGSTFYPDADADGYGDVTADSFFTNECIPPIGYVYDSTDCDDNNVSIHPQACDISNGNGIDDNCDGIIDDNFGTIIYYTDADGDTYGAGTATPLCPAPGPGYSIFNTDCDDADAAINPGAIEIINGLDDNCDGQTDIDFWVQKSDLGYHSANVIEPAIRYGAAGFSIGNKGYIGTGFNYNAYKDFWEYDPDANSWTQKADFGGTARERATGFSIGNKGYIGTGYSGWPDAIYFKDFWEYDPDTNTWTKKADFGGSGRSGAVGFSILNKGYIGTGSSTSDFWEYDPGSDTWIQKADFGGSARTDATGFSIGSKGYIGTGISSNYSYLKDFWEFDPIANTWTQKADFGGTARSEATGLGIDGMGYLGTGYSYTYPQYKKDFWEYNPNLNTWTEKAEFEGSERSLAIGFTINSKGYIGTGYLFDSETEVPYTKNDFWQYDPAVNNWVSKSPFGGSARSSAIGFNIGSKGYIGLGSYQVDFWEYDPDTNTWTQKADFAGSPRYGATGFSIGSKGYAGTGYIDQNYFPYYGYYNDFWEYDPIDNTWTLKAYFPGGERLGATGFSIGMKGYMGTGFTYSNYFYDAIDYDDFWEYDPDNDSWSKKADFGGGVRSGATGFSINGMGYLGTGYSSTSNSTMKDFWEYDPDLNNWTQKADFAGSSRSNAVGFSIGSKGYIGTGLDENYFSTKDFWEYDPAADVWMQKADFSGSARSDAAGFSIDSKGYIGTGSFTKDFWEYTSEAVVSDCQVPMDLSTNDISAFSANLNWKDVGGEVGYHLLYKAINTAEYNLIRTPTNQVTITDLTPNTTYAWKVQTVCSVLPLTKSEASERVKFTTAPLRMDGANMEDAVIELYPNPVQNQLTITLTTPVNELTMVVFDLRGKRIDLPIAFQNNQAQINTSGLPDGIYTLQIANNKTGMNEVRKFVKQK